MMEGSSAFSTSSTSSPASVWLSALIGRSDQRISLMSCPTCSSCAARAAITYRQPFFPTCNGPEFVAKAVRDLIAVVGARTAYIEPGSPWENGYCNSFNAKLRDEGPQRRKLLQPGRCEDHHRELAPALQPQAPAFIAGVSAPGSAIRSRFAGHASRSAQTRHALRPKPDHPMGAGQLAER